MQHFTEVLNRPEPENPAHPQPSREYLDINTDPPTEEEVTKAIKSLKNGKAAGIDLIHAEMLKADITTSTRVLTDLFTCIWTNSTTPDDWTNRLIVKLPKKGDLGNCENWRGITLLSIPSKVFYKILLSRIDTAIDGKLRPEQAGFRKGKGCIDQSFTLYNIIEQSLQWNAPLHVNFIDFKKAFDSVHRDSLSKIISSYDIPQKLVKPNNNNNMWTYIAHVSTN